jgi:hypothetical protein
MTAGDEIRVMFGSVKPERVSVIKVDEHGADIQSPSGRWRMTPRTKDDPPTLGKLVDRI